MMLDIQCKGTYHLFEYQKHVYIHLASLHFQYIRRDNHSAVVSFRGRFAAIGFNHF